MTVEERKGASMGRESGQRDQFPVGMRVLAVDDDPTCLKMLEGLLRRCQYHVTTTGQAITALKLLRENKDKFDLVISDVHMPDMDGFKLLELVGLEMDLPVIMLSANGETSAVMKGITHGACDYLLKPVRLEELKNIWQHVVRRRKFDPKDHNNVDNGDEWEKNTVVNAESGQCAVTGGSIDRNGKVNRKRKDQDEDDEDDYDENGNENDDPSSQKKPRVVWSVDLHRKFVAAVNQLGIEKAVPKRILDLMNVERLTRENVASHLQKYRLYLKRLSAVASQQANMVAALGGRDPSYLPMGSLNGFGNYHSLVGSSQLPGLTSFQPNGILNRQNYTTGFGLRNLAPSGMVQFCRTQSDVSNPLTDLNKLQCVNLPGNQRGNVLQGMPASLALDQLQQHKVSQDVNKCISGGLSGPGLASVSSPNSFITVSNSPLLLQSQQQHAQSSGFGNQFSINVPSLSSDAFDMTAGSSNFCDISRCNDTWQDAVQLTRHPNNNLPMVAPFSNGGLAPNSMAVNATSMVSHLDGNLHDASSSSVSVAPLHDSVVGTDMQFQASTLGGNVMITPATSIEDSKYLNFRSPSKPKQECENQKLDRTHKLNLLAGSPLSSSLQNPSIISLPESQRINDGLCDTKTKMNMIGETNSGAIFFPQNRINKSAADVPFKDEYISDFSRLQGGFSTKDCILDDIVNAAMKPDRDDFSLMDGNMRCEMFPLDACL
ncbi:hypothetical protein J5N97_027028 [Dioscorea zingiberensis]|uniref:Two-component response regulator n=1 Tax=Dioscorea zingiberensis TaxID=325984 RepID=A0A9D5C3Z6_9LILI|nr:hypothetical protein J5N97_027028 [Dioscorea zingiberensis]